MTTRATHALRLLPVVVLLVGFTGVAGSAFAQDGGVRPLQAPEPPQPPQDDGGSPVEIIRQVITNIHRILIPGQTMLDALNRVLASAILGASGAETGAVFGRLASQVSNAIGEIFRPEELVAVADSTRPLAAGLAVPFFLLRLAIYHWRRLTGDQDSAVGVVGDWIVAAGWGFAAGQVVTIVLGLGVDLATQAFGSLPGLVGQILGQLAPRELALTQLVGMNFIGSIVMFATGLGVVAAAVGMLWAFAMAGATAFILAAMGPAIGVVGVVPQLRWLRSFWLKLLVVLALFPLAIGAVFKAQALVIVPAGGGLLAGPVGSVIRLMWLWGAVGFLFTMAGMAGRFSLSTGMEVGTGVIRAGKAVLDLGLAAGAGLATGGVGSLAAEGLGAIGAASEAVGTLGAGSLGGFVLPGREACDGDEGGSADPTSSGGAGSSGAPNALSSHQQAAAALASAAYAASQASRWSAVGMNRTAGAWHARGRQAELQARQHELNARIAQYLENKEDDWGDFGGGDDLASHDPAGPPAGPPSVGGTSGAPSAAEAPAGISPSPHTGLQGGKTTLPAPPGVSTWGGNVTRPPAGPPLSGSPHDSVAGGTSPSTSGRLGSGGEIISPSGPSGIPTAGGTRAGTPPPPPAPPDDFLGVDSPGTTPDGGALPATGAAGITSSGGWPERQVPPAVIRAYERGVQERGGAHPSAEASKQLFEDLVASGRRPAEIDIWFDGEPRQMGWLTAAYQQASNDPSWPSLPPGERLQQAVALAYSPIAPARLATGDYPLYDALRESLPQPEEDSTR